MIDFPASPTVGQQFTAAGVTWTWDGTKWAASGLSVAFLPLAGGTMSGPIVLAADPAANLQAATKQYVDGVRYGDNRIINGDCRIDQRNNGASGTATGYTVDRWVFNSSPPAKGSWARNSGGPSGFPYSLIFQSASAYTSAAGDYFAFDQPIEADMVSDFAWGAVGAQPVTLSFWARSSLTGTFGGAISNAANTRSYPFSYSLPAANAWTKIAITIPGDTAGTWVMSGNMASVLVWFDLGCGSASRGPANAWASANYLGVTGAVSVVGTNAATFYLTGVKLEIGSIATPFNRQSLAKSLADCQRYYQRLGGDVAASVIMYGNVIASGLLAITIGHQAMRAMPTVTQVGSWTAINTGTFTLNSGIQSLGIQSAPAAIGNVAYYNNDANSYLALNAEL
jgi:hypothetical protein